MSFNSPSFNLLTLERAIDRSPLVVGPDTSVADAMALMHQSFGISCTLPGLNSLPNWRAPSRKQSNCVLVVEGGQLVGLFTEWDAVRLTASEIDLSKVSMAKVMSQPVITLKQSNSQDAFIALSLMHQHQVHYLPVLNELGGVVGIVTPESLHLVLSSAHLLKERRVAELMTTQVITAPLSASLLSLVQLMSDHHQNYVVMVEVSAENRLFPRGIIAERDIVQFQALKLDLAQTQAQTVMGAPLFCLSPTNSLWFAQQEMQRHHLRRLLVAGEQGELLGVVTQTSLWQGCRPTEISNLSQALQPKREEQMTELGQVNQRQPLQSMLGQADNELGEGRIETQTAKSFQFNAFLEQEIRLSETFRRARSRPKNTLNFRLMFYPR